MNYLIGILIISSVVSAETKIIKLPKPSFKGKLSVEEAIFNRRSIRKYAKVPLSIKEVSQLLWATGGATCDGITGPTRAYPSAGGIYPLEIYLVVGDVKGLKSGLYHYLWETHALKLHKTGDLRSKLMRASWNQRMVGGAPISIVFAANFKKTTRYYGKRGERYVMIDLGHAAENLHLQAEALNLGTVAIGAFSDSEVKKILGIEEVPVYIMPVGKKPR